MRDSARHRALARFAAALTLVALAIALGAGRDPEAGATGTAEAPTTPIQHVVLLFQENHSFNEVFGKLCINDGRCQGTLTGKTHDNRTISLLPGQDIIPGVAHGIPAQIKAINDGNMNGYDLIKACGQSENYICYQAYAPSQIPNLTALAREFVISDRTFADERVPTFGAHAFILSASLDGFEGKIPQYDKPRGFPRGKGWGCDSNKDTTWRAFDTDPWQTVPSCVPDESGFGPYRTSPVSYAPTIYTRLQDAGISWAAYQSMQGDGGYQYAGCTYFAECLYGAPNGAVRDVNDLVADAAAGALPAVTVVTPTGPNSQHNGSSMKQGDNWIGDVANAITHGPQWGSTAIFITYDDCGCFYDQVAPPNGWGLREPMVIISPYAKRGYTDSTDASFASWLAFVEHNWNLAPLTQADATAYDYANSFDFTQRNMTAPRMVHSTIPAWERRWLADHPVDEEDPT